MFFRLISATVIGVDSDLIEIEVDLKKGLPQLSIVGLPDPAVREAKERVNSAIRNSGYTFPLGKITINLAPADKRKEGSIFDLGIALGILAVSGQIQPSENMHSFIILGELSLDGYVRPIHGILAILEKAKKIGIQNIILPSANCSEARLIAGLRLFPVQYLRDAVEPFSGKGKNCGLRKGEILIEKKRERGMRQEGEGDFSEVRGQNYAVRAVEIAAAGGHNILPIGSQSS